MKLAPLAAALLATALFASEARAQCADGLPCKLGTGLDNAASIDPEIAPDGTRVVFTHTPEGGRSELFSAVTRSNAAPVRLTPAGEFGARHDQPGQPPRALHAVDGPGHDAVQRPDRRSRLRSRHAGRQRRDEPADRLSPDGGKVVFASPSADRLLVVPITGPASAAKRLTDPFVAGGTTGSRRSASTAGRSSTRPIRRRRACGSSTACRCRRVQARALQQQRDLPGRREHRQRHRAVPREPGRAGRVKLSRPMPSGWDLMRPVDGDGPGRIVPDGSRVLYEIGVKIGPQTFRELYSVPMGGPGSASVRLDHPPLVPEGQMFESQYLISPDGSRVGYVLVDQRLDDRQPPLNYLLSVPTAGPGGSGRVLTFPDASTSFRRSAATARGWGTCSVQRTCSAHRSMAARPCGSTATRTSAVSSTGRRRSVRLQRESRHAAGVVQRGVERERGPAAPDPVPRRAHDGLRQGADAERAHRGLHRAASWGGRAARALQL